MLQEFPIRSTYDGQIVAGDSGHYRDAVCSFCGRHDRDVRVVANDSGLIICQVCVAMCAEIFDEEVGVTDPEDWRGRWPLKESPPLVPNPAPPRRATASTSIPFHVVIHSDWSTSPHKRWSAEARLVDGEWAASAPRLVPDPLALVTSGESKLLGFDFPIGLPMAYASRAGIIDFMDFLPKCGNGDWASFYLPATTPDEISIHRPFYPRRPGGTKHQHLLDALGASSMSELRRRCDHGHDGRGPAEAMFWTLGAKQVGRAAIAGWRDLLAPALDRIHVWPFQGDLTDLCTESSVVVCETYPSEFYGHLGLPRQKTPTARVAAAGPLIAAAESIGIRLERPLIEDIQQGLANDDAYDALVGLLGMLNVVQGFRSEAPPLEDAVRRVEGWMLGRA